MKNKTTLILLLFLIFFGDFCLAKSYLYVEQKKGINGSYEYAIPKVEWNHAKWAGKFFGNSCYYLSEFEGALVYTAPRSSMFAINHHSIEGNWNFGVELSPFWATYSLGGRYYISGNSSGIPEGLEGYNFLRLGIEF